MQWENLIEAIIGTGLTQAQIAKEAGCGQATISDLASGKTREPRGSLGLGLVAIGAKHGVQVPTVIFPTEEAAQDSPKAADPPKPATPPAQPPDLSTTELDEAGLVDRRETVRRTDDLKATPTKEAA